MEYKIQTQKGDIYYSIRKNKLSKKMRISIREDGRVLVSVPTRVSFKVTHEFVKDKKNWLLKNFKRIKSIEEVEENDKNERENYRKQKEEAREIIKERVDYFNSFYNFEFSSIRIKSLKTQWGSCSKKKNLNFNYKVAFLPSMLRDYIIAHEICHLKFLNHSKDFHNLIEKTIPNHRACEKRLRKHKIHKIN